MKKLIAGLSIAVVALATSGTAFASSISNVSDSSLASIVNNWFSTLTVTNANSAFISNIAVSTANSGNNTATSADDQTNTSITTGGANAASAVDNAANQNETTITQESPAASGDAVTNVGDESTATIVTTDTENNTTDNANNVGNFNLVTANSQTGNNAAVSGDSLTGTGVVTGLSQSLTAITNSFNLNVHNITRTLRNF